MPLERLNKFWKDLRRPPPPPPQVMLDDDTGLTCQALREQLLLIGTPDQHRVGLTHLLRACAAYDMSVSGLGIPDGPWKELLPEGSVTLPAATADETERSVYALLQWSQSKSAIYTPQVWPFVLVVGPGLSAESLEFVLTRMAALRGHNFAVMACIDPSQVYPVMRALFGNVVCWSGGLAAARQVRMTDLSALAPDQATLITRRSGSHPLAWPPAPAAPPALS